MKSIMVLTALFSIPAFAVPTTVTVRAISRDAKVIGSGVGGARITIRDAASGRVLAEGIQSGGTGDTAKIMSAPHARGGNEYGTEGAASFVATIDIAVPTIVEISAEGPLKFPQAIRRASKTLLLIPGQHIDGEGVLLEIHGFIIDIQQASAERVRMKMNMACGCPIEPDGMWDANRITVTARLFHDEVMIAEKPMNFAGETSIFETAFADAPAGTYTLQIIAADASNANFGMATTQLVIGK